MYTTLPWEGRKKESDDEQGLMHGTRRQPGVTFPSAAEQEYIMIIRLDLATNVLQDISRVRKGLGFLCGFFDNINSGRVRMFERTEHANHVSYPLSRYKFTSTLGFGKSFFDKLGIPSEKRPGLLISMPDHYELGDPFPYTLKQTDLILQLGSTKDFVNRWVFQNDTYHRTLENETDDADYTLNDRDDIVDTLPSRIHDIESAIEEWAIVTDTHSGFQRTDGRNLMGFYDGISNPNRNNGNVIWLTEHDEGGWLKDGTYMVFQKIEHDLEEWGKLSVRDQEKWIGRSKATGLLLGTLSEEDDQKLARDCLSDDESIREEARELLSKLLNEQSDPEKEFFSGTDSRYKNIELQCPAWSHARKSNPRGADGTPKKLIYRRGYLFMTDGDYGQTKSGILFICFQRDIREGFQYIKKNFLNNKNFPTPDKRSFTTQELAERHVNMRFSEQELMDRFREKGTSMSSNSKLHSIAIDEARNLDSQNTGREGFAGPSKLGIKPEGDILVTRVLGGGYYLVPPIPSKSIVKIGEQFFGNS